VAVCKGRRKSAGGSYWQYFEESKKSPPIKEKPLGVEWKPFQNFENYEISNAGHIWNKKEEILMKTYIEEYETVSLRYGQKYGKRFLVHRMVAQHFIPNPNNFPIINHIDGNKRNNRVENLEWTTASQNSLHSVNVLGKKNQGRKILCFDFDGQFIQQFKSIKEASNVTKANKTCISQVASGDRNTSGGYIWKYVNDSVKRRKINKD
jgi:hypothetical protein